MGFAGRWFIKYVCLFYVVCAVEYIYMATIGIISSFVSNKILFWIERSRSIQLFNLVRKNNVNISYCVNLWRHVTYYVVPRFFIFFVCNFCIFLSLVNVIRSRIRDWRKTMATRFWSITF